MGVSVSLKMMKMMMMMMMGMWILNISLHFMTGRSSRVMEEEEDDEG